MQLQELISPERIEFSMPVTSKKRLLEQLSTLMHADEPGLDEYAAFQSLLDRERLGSTGIGHGVALPHGRLKGLDKAIGAFATLEKEVEYDAIDHEPIKMVFALLVPEHATEDHLQLLARIATVLNNDETRANILGAKNKEEIYQYLTNRETG
ncbi:MAG: PTS sugar transporter subunit IIA [Acidiferrobacterales bacterium]